jgi:sugar phosphate isomerase/epimerase
MSKAAEMCKLHQGFLIAVIAGLLSTCQLSLFAAEPPYAFFAFDNGVGRGQWAPEKQAATLKTLGYDGISYNLTTKEALSHWQRAFRDRGLKIYGLYVHTFVDGSRKFQGELWESIEILKGSQTVIWLNIQSHEKRRSGLDQQAVENVREVADRAAAAGLRVVLYPHANFYVETAEDALRIFKQVERKNVMISFNLCHELMKGNADRLDEIIKATAPYLGLVSINGADLSSKNYIQRLDQGGFDVEAVMKKLKAAGYTGPVGLQCYSIEGDITENLTASITAWNSIRQALIQEKVEASAGK